MALNQNAMFPPEVPFPDPWTTRHTHESDVPVPMIYEAPDVEGLTLRAYAAIQLRLPESGIDWLDRMIERSRTLDRQAAKAAGRNIRT